MFQLIKDTFKMAVKVAGVVLGGLTGASIFVAMCDAVSKANESEKTE
nr:MAG TPA: hypothetical protein [Caudoviricetes sp.]